MAGVSLFLLGAPTTPPVVLTLTNATYRCLGTCSIPFSVVASGAAHPSGFVNVRIPYTVACTAALAYNVDYLQYLRFPITASGGQVTMGLMYLGTFLSVVATGASQASGSASAELPINVAATATVYTFGVVDFVYEYVGTVVGTVSVYGGASASLPFLPSATGYHARNTASCYLPFNPTAVGKHGSACVVAAALPFRYNLVAGAGRFGAVAGPLKIKCSGVGKVGILGAAQSVVPFSTSLSGSTPMSYYGGILARLGISCVVVGATTSETEDICA